ncbi:MFS transporter, NNP family, nitrate/nitrite transporter [Nonomuraea maritima]|uniref:MFS transporter, NNP family, nitrate/nitrite transporter n=1 Tax=Nonomuraea maritima TaxID=683260 RepID=A0A1G9FAC2_9ACTN|nr:MFS transporter [Nonomuraea maritima]SDK85320.1 MFS transporter, NNP family, nitrate/nitrite transporter [Nonomuraea maritima]
MARWTTEWHPDDPVFWDSTGRRVARRNLVVSIVAEHLGFTVWTLWSVVATKMGSHEFSTDQLFWLVALPNLVGSVLRVPYTFGPARFGGRNFTVVSALLLLVPAVLLGVAVGDPDTPYWMFLVIAALAGVGGGNFASSMANITYFYPRHKQGVALGLNAAGGNIGVSSVQLVMPLVIGSFGLAAAGWFWIPFIVVAAACSWLFMDNLTSAKADPRQQLAVAGKAQTWIMSLLYIGTFGSFIGYSTAFPLLSQSLFPAAPHAAVAFAGPLLGSLVRPVGGWLADRFGGAPVTLWNFAVMGGGVLLVWRAGASGDFWLFFLAFQVLFLASGVGNGSTYRMIPAIFQASAVAERGESEEALLYGRQQASAAIGIVSAVGAVGGFLINRAFGMSFAASGTPVPAFLAFGVFYAACFAVTWWCYVRKVSVVAGLAHARV